MQISYEKESKRVALRKHETFFESYQKKVTFSLTFQKNLHKLVDEYRYTFSH